MGKIDCAKLDSCYKIMIILDKDMLDFQYVDCINDVCGKCTNKEQHPEKPIIPPFKKHGG
jgi:hypothetical protein